MVEIKEIKKALTDLENIATKEGYTGANIVTKIVLKQCEILKIIFEAPFILERLFEMGKLGEDAKHRYMWGTISAEDVEKVKEFFADGKRD